MTPERLSCLPLRASHLAAAAGAIEAELGGPGEGDGIARAESGWPIYEQRSALL